MCVCVCVCILCVHVYMHMFVSVCARVHVRVHMLVSLSSTYLMYTKCSYYGITIICVMIQCIYHDIRTSSAVRVFNFEGLNFRG